MTDGQAGIFLLDLTLILILAQLSGRVARWAGQPPVLGEILAGILVGPSLLHGEIARNLFPVPVRPFLTAVADLGLVAFMFTIGMEFDRRARRRLGRVTAGTALGATLLPFGTGVLLASYLAARNRVQDRAGFVLFMGVAMAVTAFPVLARIVADRRMGRTFIGTVALSAAAVCDITAWTMLALVQAAVEGVTRWQLVLMIPYTVLMLRAVRPALAKLLAVPARPLPLSPLPLTRLAVVLAGLLASAGITQLIGLHFVFGAFLFGLVMPGSDEAPSCGEILDRMQFATVLLLPAYFVIAGLQVNLATVGTWGLAELGLIMAAAVTGKFGGAFLGARAQGLPAREAATLATLMNTRGLTELVVLSVGLQAGLLDRRLYSLMVVMAVVTTAMAGLLLPVLAPRDTGGSAAGGADDPAAQPPPRSGDLSPTSQL